MKRPPNKEKLQDGSDAATEGASDLDPLWKAYSECKSELGEAVLTCDPGKALQPYGVQKSSEVPCYCSSEYSCIRYQEFPIPSGVVAAFVAYGGGDLPDDVDSVAERIYSDANLSSSGAASYPDSDAEQSDDEDGTDACDNGLLLIYAAETRSLFFYPGSSLAGVFDHLQTHKRRIEPKALPSYLEAMLAILQRRTPDSLAIQRTSPARVGWSGWEVVVGMIGAVIIVSITAAAILAVVLTGCFRVKRKGSPYVDELEACRRYEKECKEWTKRARHLAKQRAKMMRAMQKPNWAAKVEAARRRLNERKSSSVAPLGSAAEPTDVVGGPTGDQPQPTFPYYIVSEPSSVYNSNHFFNWTSADEGDTAHVDQTPLGTMRSDRHGVGSMMTDGIPG